MNEEKPEWYSISNAEEIDTPCLVIYPQRVKRNIDTAIAMAGDSKVLRPHIKTHKTREATELMLAAGITKFKCATISEAELLASCGAPDVLLAYQPVGPKIRRFASLIRDFPTTVFSCLVDNRSSAEMLSEAGASEGIDFRLFVDINTGMNRTGVLPGKAAADVFSFCASLNGLHPVGLHVYDGQIRDADMGLRKQHCDEVFAEAVHTKDLLVEMGFPAPVIVAGGSPTFSIHCKRKEIECSPGTFVFWDKGYADLCPEQPFECAALVITRVISIPASNLLCLDLGHKSVAAENEIGRRIFFLNAPGLKPVSQSEEHLVVDAGLEHGYTIGDLFYGLPVHICPTCSLYERALTIEDGRWSGGEWKISARDRRISV